MLSGGGVWGTFKTLNLVLAALVALSFVLIECLIGGTRFVFSIPAYAILGLAGMLCVFRERTEAPPKLSCLIATGVAFAYLLIRIHFSPVGYLSQNDLFSAVACLTVYALTAYRLHEPRSRFLIVGALLALSIFELFVSLHQFTKGDNWMPFGFIRYDYGRRASGTFISAIHLAGLLEVVGVFALAFAFWSKWKAWARMLSGYIGVLCYVGVAITGSRGGYISSLAALATLAGLGLYVIHQARPAKFRRSLILTTIAGVMVISGGISLMKMDETLRTRLEMIPSQFEQDKRDVRIFNWQAALDQFRTSPIFGTGAGTHLYFGRYFRRVQIQTDPVHAHSDYLELLAEYGIVGAALMAALVGVHGFVGAGALRTIVRSELSDLDRDEPARSNEVAMLIGSLSAVAAYLAHSTMDFNLHIPGNALIMAFTFGTLANPALAPLRSKSRNWHAGRWIPPLAAACLLVLALPRFRGEYWSEKARVALRNESYLEAITLAERSLSYHARNPEVYFLIGEANRSIGMNTRPRSAKAPYFRKAIDAYQETLKLFPQDEHSWVRMGQTFDQLREFDRAEDAYRTAIALDPRLGVLHRYYALHLEARGRADESQAEFERAAYPDRVD